MNKSTKISVVIVSLYACILSVLHGLFEIFQGLKKTDGFFVYAISRDNQKNEMWHGNFPAITIMPNYSIAGICTILLSVVIIFYIFRNFKSKYNVFIMIILSLMNFMFGGGFVPFFLLIIASISSLFVNVRFRTRQQKKAKRIFSIIWIICIALLIGWSVGEWIVGYFFNDFMVEMSHIFFLIGIILPISIIFLGILSDITGNRI